MRIYFLEKSFEQINVLYQACETTHDLLLKGMRNSRLGESCPPHCIDFFPFLFEAVALPAIQRCCF